MLGSSSLFTSWLVDSPISAMPSRHSHPVRRRMFRGLKAARMEKITPRVKSRFGTVPLNWWKYKPCISFPFRDLCHVVWPWSVHIFDPLICFVSGKAWFLLDRPLNFSLFRKESWNKNVWFLMKLTIERISQKKNKLSSITMRCVDWTRYSTEVALLYFKRVVVPFFLDSR